MRSAVSPTVRRRRFATTAFHQDVDALIEQITGLARSVKLRRLTKHTVDPSQPWTTRDPDWFAARPEPIAPPLLLEWPADAVSRITADTRSGLSRELEPLLEAMLQRLWRTKGVLIPGICMMESADPGWDRVVHILGASAAREELTELSAECEDIRARIAEADAQLDAEMPEPPSAEHRLDTMLHTMASLLVSVCKLNNRRDELLAATSDEEREFVTEEICLIETEMERSDSGQDMSVSTEVTDMLGDYFDQSKRGST